MIQMRSVFLGAAVGIIIGVYISPMINAPKIVSFQPQLSNIAEPTNPASQPTPKEALQAIFKTQDWNWETQSVGATVTINRCGQSLTALVCEIVLDLPWVAEPTRAQVEFGKIDEVWIARKMRAAPQSGT